MSDILVAIECASCGRQIAASVFDVIDDCLCEDCAKEERLAQAREQAREKALGQRAAGDKL